MQGLKNKALETMRSSERLFKIDMIYMVKGGLWTTLSFAVGTLASIVTMIAFGNLLPRETYGIYTYLLSLGASLSFLTLSGTGIGVMRAVARGYENVVPTALRLQLKYNLLAVATVLAGSAYYGLKGNLIFAASLMMLSLAYPVAEAFHIYKQILTGRKRFDTMTRITSVTSLVGAVATVTALLLTDNVLILISVYTLMSLLPNIIAYKSVTKHLDKTKPDPEQVREMRRTAFHLTYAGIIGVIASYIDRIVLFQVAGPAALAVYGFAMAGPERLKSLIKNWVTITVPRNARKSLSEIRRVLYKRVGLSLLIGSALSLIYWFLAPVLFRLFLPRYLDAIIYSRVLALSLVLVPATIYIGSIFASQNMLRASYALNIGSNIMRIIIFLVFGWLWQIWGLVIASLLFSLINAVYSIAVWEIESRRLINKNE